MNEDDFWRLIDECRLAGPDSDPDAERLAVALAARLTAAGLPAVIGFAEHLAAALFQLDRWEYGADLSGDAFLYTRAAVVAAGRAEYGAVLGDPTQFRPYARDLVWAEALLYVPDRAYRRLTGREWEHPTRHSYESFSNAEGWAGR
ncbi:DUF4240 domain-containing protein [Kitasatospora sp. NPDC028055]|uniref:DUF4240 domain-containing protein n=1 Tax=Kitasatospora sp. NPDC028055 TaxID=3155653 RepID=UPI0033F43D01